MANIIDSLLITMGLDGSGVSKGMDQVENRLASGVKNITGNILAPLAGAFAFGKLLSGFTQSADAAGKLARHLRADTQAVQAWGSAVEASGGDANALNGTLNGLEETLRASQFGAGSAELRQLGVRTRDAGGNLKNSVDILTELAGAAERIRPEKFERLTKSLGVDPATIRLLQKGGSEVDRLVTKYKDLAYTQKDADTARKFNVVMSDLNKTFQAGAAIFMRYLIPALTIVAQKTEITVNFLRRHEKFVLLFFMLLAGVIAYKLTPAIWAMSKAWLANPMVKIIALVLLLALALEDLWHFVQGNGSAIEDLMRKFGASEKTIARARVEAKAFLEGLKKWGPATAIVIAGIKGVTVAMKLLNIATLSNPVIAFLAALSAAAYYLIANWDKVKAHLNSFFEWIDEKLKWFEDTVQPILDDFNMSIAADPADNPPDYGTWGEWTPIRIGGAAVSPAAVGAAGGSVTTTINGGITVQTQATDAGGIARDIGGAVERRMVAVGNRAVNP